MVYESGQYEQSGNDSTVGEYSEFNLANPIIGIK